MFRFILAQNKAELEMSHMWPFHHSKIKNKFEDKEESNRAEKHHIR